MSDLRGAGVLMSGFHTPDAGRVADPDRVVIDFDRDGTILSVTPPGAMGHDPAGKVDLSDCVAIPGLADLHVQAPRYPQLGMAPDVPLEGRLFHHTFPLAARDADTEFARKVYAAMIDDLLAAGTTAVVYFSTIHDAATCILGDLCLEKGQRALVGRVAMDHPDNPPLYRDADTAVAVAGTRAVIDHIRGYPGNAQGLVRPIITPRFIPACTDDLLAALGRLAAESGAAKHVAESDRENAHVRARHGTSDAETLDRFGLVTRHGVLAHGVFLGERDLAILRARGRGRPFARCRTPVSQALPSPCGWSSRRGGGGPRVRHLGRAPKARCGRRRAARRWQRGCSTRASRRGCRPWRAACRGPGAMP